MDVKSKREDGQDAGGTLPSGAGNRWLGAVQRFRSWTTTTQLGTPLN